MEGADAAQRAIGVKPRKTKKTITPIVFDIAVFPVLIQTPQLTAPHIPQPLCAPSVGGYLGYCREHRSDAMMQR
ncbi:MAG: hypothetical protein M0Z50_09140, partial [Planctomycetia bacterium]|nr:hypothetical protein [Planctomycetia bacterium]